jgi:hypothetical protein
MINEPFFSHDDASKNLELFNITPLSEGVDDL